MNNDKNIADENEYIIFNQLVIATLKAIDNFGNEMYRYFDLINELKRHMNKQIYCPHCNKLTKAHTYTGCGLWRAIDDIYLNCGKKFKFKVDFEERFEVVK